MSNHHLRDESKYDDSLSSLYDQSSYHAKDDPSSYSSTLPSTVGGGSSSGSYDIPTHGSDSLYPSIDQSLKDKINQQQLHIPDESTSFSSSGDKSQKTLYQDAMESVNTFLDNPIVQNIASSLGTGASSSSSSSPTTTTTTTTSSSSSSSAPSAQPHGQTFGQNIGATIGSIGGGLLDGSIDRKQGASTILNTLKTGLLTLGLHRPQPTSTTGGATTAATATTTDAGGVGDLASSISAVGQSFNQLQNAVGQVGQQTTSHVSRLSSAIRGLGGLFQPAHPRMVPTHTTTAPASTPTSSATSSATPQTTNSLTDTLQTIQGISALAANVDTIRNTLGSTLNAFGSIGGVGEPNQQQQHQQQQQQQQQYQPPPSMDKPD